MFSGQATASFAFGAAISAAGVIGTPIGGWWLDRDIKRRWNTLQAAGDALKDGGVATDGAARDAVDEATSGPMLDLKLVVAMRQVCALFPSPLSRRLTSLSCPFVAQSFILTALGTVVCFVGIASSLHGIGPFFACITVGCTFLFANTAGVNLAIMASVPPESRPFTIGLATLILHLFGAVAG